MKINKHLIFTFLFSISTFLSTQEFSFATQSEIENEEQAEVVIKEEFVKNYGGSNNEYFYSSAKTSDGGYVAVGLSASTDLGFENKGSNDAIIVKFDIYGNREWISSYGNTGVDEFYSVTEDINGNFVAVGRTEQRGILAKFAKGGNLLSTKSMGVSGSSNSTILRGVSKTSDGGVVVVGHANAASPSDGISSISGETDAFIMKFNSSLNREWTNMYRTAKTEMYMSTTVISDGGIIAVGYGASTTTTDTGNDIIVSKYNPTTGAAQWTKRIVGNKADCAYGVTSTSDGGFVVVGDTTSNNIEGLNNMKTNDAIIAKYDCNGKLIWIKNYGGTSTDTFRSVVELENGDILACGNSLSTDAGFENNGANDIVMLKYNKDGEQLWLKSIGGSGNDYAYSILYIDNNIITIGYSNSTDLGFLNQGYYDGLIIKHSELDVYLEAILKAEESLTKEDLEAARDLVNAMPEGTKKESYQIRLGMIFIGEPFIPTDMSSNIDIFIENKNSLTMTLSTNQITFEEFDATEDVILEQAFNVTISSSLPYSLNAYLVTEIQNLDKTTNMDKEIFNLKENSESDYQHFENVGEKMILKDNCPSGNNTVHPIDIKLKSGLTYKKDIYRTTIKIQAEQK